MPDVKVTEVPATVATPTADREPRQVGTRRGFTTSPTEYESRRVMFQGEVTAALPLWLRGPDGKPVKHYDTRIRYDNEEGTQFLQLTVPAINFLPLGTKVRVDERGEAARVVPLRPRPAPSGSWKQPDLKASGIVFAIVLGITLVIGVIGWLIGKSKQDEFTPTQPTGSISIPIGSPPAGGPSGPQPT